MLNRKLSTMICAAAMAFSVYGVHSAMAQKGVMFTSQGDWVTKDLASSRKGAKPYCVAAMQFSKDTILTVAENKTGELSFAFDFGGGYFDPEVTSTVILDPGAGQQRAYEVKPRSSKAIVIKLGYDSAFMDALERTGLLRMEIGDQSLNFNLANIDRGRAKLSECLDGVIVVSAPNAVPPPGQNLHSTSEEAAIEMEELRSTYEARIDVLRQKLQEAEAKAEAVASGAAPQGVAQGEPEELMPGELPSLDAQPQYETLQYEIKTLKTRLAQALAERDAALAAKDKASDMAAREQIQMSKDKEVAQALLAENKALKAQVALLEGAGNEEIQAVRENYKKLQAQYESLKNEKLADEQKLSSLKNELVEIKTNHQKSAKASDLKSKEMDQKFSELLEEKQNVIALEAENAELKAKLTEMEKDYKTQVARTNTELDQLSKAYDVAVVDLERVSKENGEMKAALAKAEILQKQAENSDADDAERLEQELAELLAEKEKAIAMEAENSALKSKLQTMESDYRQQLAGLSTKYEALEQAYETTKTELEQSSQTIGKLKAELAQLEVDKQKAEAMSSLQSSDQGVDSEALLAARQRAIALEAENVSLKAQVESLEDSFENELGSIKEHNDKRAQELRERELEVMALRAEAERQLAEARAVKSARVFGGDVAGSDGSENSDDSVEIYDVLSETASAASGAVSSAAQGGAEVVSSLSAAPVEETVSVPAFTKEQIAQAPDATRAQQMEREVMEELARSSSVSATPGRAVETAAVAEESVLMPSSEALISAQVQPVAGMSAAADIEEADDAALAEVVVEEISEPQDNEVEVSVVEEETAETVDVAAEQEEAEVSSEELAGQDVQEGAQEPATPVQKPVYATSHFGDMLSKAHIEAQRGINMVDDISDERFQAYEWRAENVFGSAEQKPLEPEYSFEDYVLSYLENTEKRCNGEFAIEPALSVGEAGQRVDSYEVACIGEGMSSAAAIVFYEADGKFTTVAHEAPTANMDQAMDLRDRYVRVLTEERSG